MLCESKLSHTRGKIAKRNKFNIAYRCGGIAAIHDRCGCDFRNRSTDGIEISGKIR